VNGRPTVYIDVTNLGHRPTTVREVGFYAHPREFEIIREGGSQPWATAKGEITFATGPFFLDAGQSERVELVPDIDAWGIHADFPLRVYAVDIRHRRIWGDAAPIVRMLVGENPPLHDSDSEELKRLFIPPKPELRPSQVEPGWKIWKRCELRRPQTWRLD